jgi:hypothetical protein
MVGVVAVGHRFVPATWAVAMRLVVPAALVVRRTPRGIRGAHRDRVLLDLRPALKMQMPVVEIVLVPVVLDPSVATVGAVNVRVGRVRVLGLRLKRHWFLRLVKSGRGVFAAR